MSGRMRFLLTAFPVILSLTVTGCGLQDLLGNKKKQSASGGQGQKPAIAVFLSPDNPNRPLIMQGIQEMAKKSNVQVKDVTGGAQDEQGQTGQGSAQGSSSSSSQGGDQGEKGNGKSPLEEAKVLILAGQDQNIMQTAQQKKIPVVALGSLPAGVDPVGVILPDPEKTGELMAQTLVNKLSEGQIIIMQGDPNESASQEILAGNRSVLSRYPKLVSNVISSPPGSESVAMQNFSDFLRKNPGKVNGVLAHSERLAAQAYEVLKQAQLDKKVILVGGQANTQSLQRMATESQLGDIDTNPYLQGVSAYQWAQKIIDKEPLDVNESITGDHGEIPAKFVPVKAVTPDNLALVQQSYAKAMAFAQQATAEKQTGGSSQGKDQGGTDNKSGQDGQGGSAEAKGQGQNQAAGNSRPAGQTPASIPDGADKVKESVHTEITREYLDAQGKIIGTEKNSSDQVRTIPPQLLLQEQAKAQTGDQQQKSGGQGDQKGQSSDQQADLQK